MKNSLALISVTFIILSAFVIAGAQKVSVSGLIDEKSVKPGKSANAQIILKIPGELHVNSNKPKDEFLIPTSVKFTNSNLKITKIVYPKGILQKFNFSEKRMSVYEGNVIIKFTFLIPANYDNDKVKIDAVVQYQACNQEVCFAPTKEKIRLKAKIK